MPTTLPPPEPPVSTMLLEIARLYTAAGLLLVAIWLLRARLGPWAHSWAHSLYRTGKRIGPVGDRR
jgi:hypothetical protein